MKKIILEELIIFSHKGYKVILYESPKHFPVEISEHYGFHLLIEPIWVEIYHEDKKRLVSKHIVVYGYIGGVKKKKNDTRSS